MKKESSQISRRDFFKLAGTVGIGIGGAMLLGDTNIPSVFAQRQEATPTPQGTPELSVVPPMSEMELTSYNLLPKNLKDQVARGTIRYSPERMGYVRMNPNTGLEELWRHGMAPNKKNEKTGTWVYENEEAGWMTETDRRTFTYQDTEGNPGQVTVVFEVNTTLGIGTRGYKSITFGPDIDLTFPRFAQAVFGPDMNGKTIIIPWVPGSYPGGQETVQKFNGNFVIPAFYGKNLTPSLAFGGEELGDTIIERVYHMEKSLKHSTDEYGFGGGNGRSTDTGCRKKFLLHPSKFTSRYRKSQ